MSAPLRETRREVPLGPRKTARLFPDYAFGLLILSETGMSDKDIARKRRMDPKRVTAIKIAARSMSAWGTSNDRDF